MFGIRILLAGIGLVLVCSAAVSADVVIQPGDGKLEWVILTYAPANEEYVQRASTELASLIERMINVKPATVTIKDKSEVDRHHRYIAIGRLAVDLGAVPPESKFKCDGSVVVVETNRILLAGETSISSYFAMTRLAEMAGCRWYMPGKLGEVIPAKSSLTFKEGIYPEVPFMWQRTHSMNGYESDEGRKSFAEWMLHNRQGGTGISTGHAWGSVLPPEKYFKEHPDWFAQAGDGKRYPWGINFSSEEVIQEFIRNTKKMLDASPGVTTFSLSQDDGYPFCICSDCMKLYSGLPDPIRPLSSPHVTDGLINFCNRVISEVEKAYPGIRYGVLAYINSFKPPVREKPLPSLIPQLAPMFYSSYHPIDSPHSESMRAMAKYIDDWSKLSPVWSYYGYGMNFMDCMLPYTREVQTRHDWPYMADRGLKYVHMDSSLGWQNLLPYYYLLARLNIDPYADSEAIVSEFYRDFFGPAAGDMRAYTDELNTAFDNLTHEPGGIFVGPLIFIPDRIHKLGRLLSSAEHKVKGDDFLKQRIAMWRFAYTCAEKYMLMRSEMNRFEFQKASDTADKIWAMLESERKNPNQQTVCPLWWNENKTFWKTPANDAAAVLKTGRLVHKFPDEWLAFADYAKAGAEKGMYKPDISLGPWFKVKTYSKILGEQGFLHHFGLSVWYRNTFQLSPQDVKGKLHIFFCGIDHTMNALYINGKRVAGPDVMGWVRTFDYDISDFVKPGENLVVVDTEGTYWEQVGGIIRPVFIYAADGGTARVEVE
ncbi:MAG: DUF4838 domain-containing protein [Armatimonadota bacterium]